MKAAWRIVPLGMFGVAGAALLMAAVAPLPAAGQNSPAIRSDGVAAETRAPTRAPTVKTCSPSKLKYGASTLSSFTGSTTFKNVPETAINFVQGGAKASCVIVHFSALAYAPDSVLFVRALLDNSPSAIPDKIQFTGDDDENNGGGAARMRSVIFVFPDVAPGSHNVKIQYRTHSAGKTVHIHDHTTLVHHVP